jgi:DNA-binding NtrC family response regulator
LPAALSGAGPKVSFITTCAIMYGVRYKLLFRSLFGCLSGSRVSAMATLRILMIENNPWVGSVLQELIGEAAQAEIIVLRSVAAAEDALAGSKFDFAFLDANVTDGKTYAIADALMKDEIPFAFMSGFIDTNEVPEGLRRAPCLTKPYRLEQIKSILSSVAI